MKAQLHRQVLESIRRHQMFRAGDRAGVAVSGGADSVALLRLAAGLREDLGVTLSVLHFNHELRGAESDADEEFVKSLASAGGLECFTARENVAAAAREHRWNLEDAARRLRYDFFERIVAQGGATRVATAHTADDQAETLLARLLRGTGLSGLSAIHPVKGSIVRPLLLVRRHSLREYLRELHQDWREDETNRDPRRLRSLLRHQLLPVLERDFSGAIVERLGDVAELARHDESFWSALVEDHFRTLVSHAAGRLTLGIPDLLAPIRFPRQPAPADASASNALRPLTQRLIRRMHRELAGSESQLSRRHVELVIHLATESTSGRRIQLPGGVIAERNFDQLSFSRAAAGTRRRSTTSQSYEYEIQLPEKGSISISVPELSRCFCLKLIDWPSPARDTKRAGPVLDVQRLRAPLVLRNWRPGDAYRPCGRKQAHKLKRMFAAGRIRSGARAMWPVLTSGGRLAWADKLPAAEEFSAGEGTRTGLWIFEEDQ